MELTLSVADRVRIYTKTFLASHHEHIIHLLYQPIIGPHAVNLYLTLWSFIQIEKKELTMSHRQLLTFFNLDIEQFQQLRNQLEAIDLLTVYYHPQQGYYLYELRQPLTADRFFRDSQLNVHLLYKVGYNLYEYLEQKFLVRPTEKGLTNITKPFNEVYPEFGSPLRMQVDDKMYTTTTNSQMKIPIRYDFDYELFVALLNKSFISTDVTVDEVKHQIIQEASLYQFDAQMMSKIVLDCVDKDGVIDFEQLHEVASSYYKRLSTRYRNETIRPAMTEEEFFKEKSIQMTEKIRQKALFNYKTKTPHEWLSILQGNTEVPNSYLEVVKMLYEDYHLASEVINVLIEFVRLRTDGRLPKEYCKTVASNWAYKKIKTAEEAMEEVDKIVEAEKAWAEKGEKVPTVVHRRKGFVASEPEWLEQHEAYRESAQDEAEDVDVNALEQLLQSFK